MSQVKPIPDGMATVTPHLVCAGAADAIDFYTRAFGGKELARMAGPDGKILHALMQLGDSKIMLVDEYQDWGSFGPNALKGTPVTIHLYVEDSDKVYEQALSAGATVHMAIADMFWGDRYGIVKDPFGHLWSIATHKRDMTPEQMEAEMKQQMQGEGC